VYNGHMSRYAKNAGAVYGLKLHLVWCPKYRRPVLVGEIERRLKELLVEKVQIHTMEVMPDHVHLFVEFDPRWSVAEIVNRLKGYTSRILREEFPQLRSKLPTLWSRSYFANTIGHISEKTVQRYIESQKGK
jgi:putative transposase